MSDSRSELRAWTVDALLRLCGHDTTTGHEDRGLEELCSLLDELGATLTLQRVAGGRTNVLAEWGTARVLLSTHVDTVPPYSPPRFDESTGRFHGRGTCDAKGQIVAQLAAIKELRDDGQENIAWLGVVGEETDSIGAKSAECWRERFTECRGLINGEPTELALGTGQRGQLHVNLVSRGRAAHSGTPEMGRSAVWPLIDWLQALRQQPPPDAGDLGPEVWNVGLIDAGVAANVVAPIATANVLARTLPGSSLLEDMRALAPPECEVEVLQSEPAQEYPRLDRFEYAIAPFGSDVPWLRGLIPTGQVALVGPGSITVAHTDDEHLDLDDLVAGVEINVRVARHFLAGETA